MSTLLLKSEIEFCIDNEGTLESHEVEQGNFTEEEVQELINSLVNSDTIHIGERTEGTITIFHGLKYEVDFRVYNSPDNSDFDEYKKEKEY